MVEALHPSEILRITPLYTPLEGEINLFQSLNKTTQYKFSTPAFIQTRRTIEFFSENSIPYPQSLSISIQMKLKSESRGWSVEVFLEVDNKLNSALQTLKKGLAAIFKMIVAALKVIAKVASMLIDAIKGFIKALFQPVMRSINKASEDFQNKMIAILLETSNPEEFTNDFVRLMAIHPVVLIATIIASVFQAALSLLGLVINFISGGTTAFMGFFIGSLVRFGTEAAINVVKVAVIPFAIGAILDYIRDKYFRSSTVLDAEIWGGYTVGSVIVFVVQLALYGTIPENIVDSDVKGLLAAVLLSCAFYATSATLSAKGHKNLALFVDFLSLIVAAYFAINALLDENTWTDSLGGVLGHIDEMLSWLIIGYYGYQFSRDAF